eukprot:scaffold3600_cov387-Prasinococcus_capsulatus_cf.AAC.21
MRLRQEDADCSPCTPWARTQRPAQRQGREGAVEGPSGEGREGGKERGGAMLARSSLYQGISRKAPVFAQWRRSLTRIREPARACRPGHSLIAH